MIIPDGTRLFRWILLACVSGLVIASIATSLVSTAMGASLWVFDDRWPMGPAVGITIEAFAILLPALTQYLKPASRAGKVIVTSLLWLIWLPYALVAILFAMIALAASGLMDHITALAVATIIQLLASFGILVMLKLCRQLLVAPKTGAAEAVIAAKRGYGSTGASSHSSSPIAAKAPEALGPLKPVAPGMATRPIQVGLLGSQPEPQVPQDIAQRAVGSTAGRTSGPARRSANQPSRAAKSAPCHLGVFVAECFVSAPGARVRATDVWNAYNEWARLRAEAPVTQTMLGRRLRQLGVPKAKIGGFVYYFDARLKRPAIAHAAAFGRCSP